MVEEFQIKYGWEATILDPILEIIWQAYNRYNAAL